MRTAISSYNSSKDIGTIPVHAAMHEEVPTFVDRIAHWLAATAMAWLGTLGFAPSCSLPAVVWYVRGWTLGYGKGRTFSAEPRRPDHWRDLEAFSRLHTRLLPVVVAACDLARTVAGNDSAPAEAGFLGDSAASLGHELRRQSIRLVRARLYADLLCGYASLGLETVAARDVLEACRSQTCDAGLRPYLPDRPIVLECDPHRTSLALACLADFLSNRSVSSHSLSTTAVELPSGEFAAVVAPTYLEGNTAILERADSQGAQRGQEPQDLDIMLAAAIARLQGGCVEVWMPSPGALAGRLILPGGRVLQK